MKIAFAAALVVPMMQSSAAPPFPVPPSANATTIRPIDDFLARQGTFCLDVIVDVEDVILTGAYEDQIVDGNFVGDCEETGAPPFLFVPPIANYIGNTDPAKGRLASVDYAGLADHWAQGAFGTTFAGKVIERPLADGRALVEVLLRTANALTYVVDDPGLETGDFANGPLLFGNRAPEVVEGAESALGKSQLHVKFINTEPGADLPDLIQLFFVPEEGQELLVSKSNNQAKGPLTALFGVPEGTPGRTHGVQVGLIGNPQCGAASPSAVADCFPAERIELHAIGQ